MVLGFQKYFWKVMLVFNLVWAMKLNALVYLGILT